MTLPVKRIIGTLASESGAVVLTAIAGFYMLHVFPKAEYGIYAFFIATVNLIIGLSEIGINHCFLPTVGSDNVTPAKVGAVMHLFLKRRFTLILISSLIVVPVTLYLAYRQSWLTPWTFSAFALMLLSIGLSVNEQLWRMGFTALKQTKAIGKATVSNAFTRFAWIIGMAFSIKGSMLMLPMAASGLLGSAAGLAVYRRSNLGGLVIASEREELQTSLEERFQKIYSPLWVPALSWVLYTNFGNLAIGWFAKVETVADVNAAGRLVMVLMIIDKMVGVFVLPQLAQYKTEAEYWNSLIPLQLVYIIGVGALVFSAWWLPDLWLLLLGNKYSNLAPLLWLAMLGPVLANASGFTFSCLASRGYTGNQMPILSAAILVNVFLIMSLGMATARNAFLINAICSAALAVGQWTLMLKWFIHFKRLATRKSATSIS